MMPMYSIDNVLFAVLFTIAVLFFLLSAWNLIRLVLLGKPDARLKSLLIRRFLTMMEYAFGQKRVVAERFGWNHFFLFWGFMILLLANFEFVANGLFPFISFRILGSIPYAILTLAFDLVSFIVLCCVAIAIYRRLVLKPSFIDYKSRDAFIILGLVAGLMIAFYGMHGAEIAFGDAKAPSWMPISHHIAGPIMSAVFGESLPIAGRIFWWLHALILLAFLNYLPYSKHMHILTAIPNCFCRSFSFVTTVSREEFKIGKTYGVSMVDDFTWKDLLDFTSCTECGRCNANCPATTTGKVLNPRYVVRDGKVNLQANGRKLIQGYRTDGILPLIGEKDDNLGTVGEEALWACTTCGACMAVCPVFIEHVPKIIKMRRHLTENLAKFPDELNAFFEAIEQRSNPWGIAPSDRAKWAKDMDIPTMNSGADIEYLFFVGCAGSFDARNKKVTASLSKVLKAAGVSFGILGVEEKCCGDSLRRLGNEFIFERLAKENVTLLQKYKIKKIVCYCPHCFSTLKNDYRQFGLEAEVIHHSELMHRLMNEGKIRLSKSKGADRIVFHDSCYLGRYNELYHEPRELLEMASGSKPMEMKRNFEKSFCCGAGGGRMWMKENPENRININRVREALSNKPDVIAVACPYCMTMFEDGIKDEKATDRVVVSDLAEIISARLE